VLADGRVSTRHGASEAIGLQLAPGARRAGLRLGIVRIKGKRLAVTRGGLGDSPLLLQSPRAREQRKHRIERCGTSRPALRRVVAWSYNKSLGKARRRAFRIALLQRTLASL
jgi:hypothetical protein